MLVQQLLRITLIFTLLGGIALAQTGVQITNYEIDFKLDVPEGRIIVDATLEADKQPGVGQVNLLLTERADLMESRAITLANQAAEANAPWLRRLGPTPATEPARRGVTAVRTKKSRMCTFSVAKR